MHRENLLASTCLSTTSPSPDSSARSRVIREWLVRFGTEWSEPIDARIALWEDELADLSPESIEQACRITLRTHRFGFPKIADLRAQIEKAQTCVADLEAAAAWENYLSHIKRFFHADIGWSRGTPRLSAIIEHCGRAAGGAHWVECCPETELQWARKRFLDAYKLVHETKQVENLIGEGEAKEILRRLSAPLVTPSTRALAAAGEMRRVARPVIASLCRNGEGE